MTKSQLDNFITENYGKLRTIAAGLVARYNKNLDASILISEAYEHCYKIINTIEDENTLQRYLIAKISMEVRYTNSRTNLRERILDSSEPTSDKEEEENDLPLLYERIETYYNTGDTIDVIFFQAYFDKGHNSIRKLHRYFGISQPIIMKMLNRIKHEITKIQIHEKI